MKDSKNKKDDSEALSSYPKLPNFEILIYFVTWIFCCFYSLKQVYHLSNLNRTRNLRKGFLEVRRGYFLDWQPLKDTLDFEWELWNFWFMEMIVYSYAIYFVLMRFFDSYQPKYRFQASMVLGMLFLIYFFGFGAFVFFISQSLIVFLFAYMTKNEIVVWVISLGVLYPLTNDHVVGKLDLYFDKNHEKLLSYICCCMMSNIRYISFCIEYCWIVSKKTDVEKNKYKADKVNDILQSSENNSIMEWIMDFMLYQFYFPLLQGGPIMTYNDFFVQIKTKPPMVWTVGFTGKYLFNLARYLFWHWFLNTCLHFFYVSSLNNDIKLLENVTYLELCGLGLCYVNFFCSKYVVIYGLPAEFSLSDNLIVPGKPHCVTSKHKFIEMWKYFDKGLHKWLVRYIYIPLGGSSSDLNFVHQTVNSALPFLFVYIWHGILPAYLYWAVFNWFGVYIEKIANDFYALKRTKEFEKQYLSPASSRRLRAMISTLPFSFLIISNIYFLGGVKCGHTYLRRIYLDDFYSFVLLHLVLYFGAQCSMEFTRRKIN